MRIPVRRVLGQALLAAMTVTSLAGAVTVEIDVNPPATVEVSVKFSARATGNGPITYSWNFGDGTRTEDSPEPSASHSYAVPGHYAVIVIARDATGPRSASFLQTIHQPVTHTSPTASSTIVYDAARNRVCNVNTDNDSVSCIDTERLERSFEAPVGAHPRTLTIASDGSIWVANQNEGTLRVLEAGGRLLRQIELGSAAAPFGVVTDPTRKRVFVTLQSKNEVVAFDVASGAEIARGKVGSQPAGIAVSADGRRLFVTRFISSQDRGEVYELDGTTLAQVRVHGLALDPGPDGEAGSRGVPNYLRQLVISPDGASAIVPSKKDNVLRGIARDGLALTFETTVRSIVSRLDLVDNRELLEQRMDFNNRALGLAAAYSPLGDYFFVAMLGSGGLSMVDSYNGNTVAGLQNVAIAPDGIALDRRGRLFLHAFLSRKVIVIDAAAALAGTAFDLPKVAEIATIDAERLAPAVLAGKKVFYDASDLRMTQHGYISCASCHLDGADDGRVWDFTDRGEGLRNTTSLLGKRGVAQGRLHWSANFDEVQDFEHDIRNAFNGTGFMNDDDFATGTRNTPLGDPKAGVSRELDDLAAYVTSLDRVRPSPFRAPDGSLTAEGRVGREVFAKAGCPDCHRGPDFTDSSSGQLHDVGTLRPTSGRRLNGVFEGIDTPTLRGIWANAPYLHDGSAATLFDVIGASNLDDRHGQTSTLTEGDRYALVSYLLQLDASDDEVPGRDEPEVTRGAPIQPEFPGCGCGTAASPRAPVLGVIGVLLAFGVMRARRRGPASTQNGSRSPLEQRKVSYNRYADSGIP